MEEKQNRINELIEENEEVFQMAFLKRFPTDEELHMAEDLLGFTIPKEYIWFLKTYGHGGCFFEFLGYGINGKAIFAEKTLSEREKGLPLHMLVIENCDEYVICIDTGSGKIVSWSSYDRGGIVHMFDDFYEYFIDCIENAIDNFDE